MTPLSARAARRVTLLLWLCCGALPQGAAVAARSFVRGAPRAAALQARSLTVVGGNATAKQAVRIHSGTNQTANMSRTAAAKMSQAAKQVPMAGAGGLVMGVAPAASVLRCALNAPVSIKAHDGSYLQDEEFMGGWMGDLFGTTVGFANELGNLQTWFLEPVEPGVEGSKLRIKNQGRSAQEGKPVYLTDEGGQVAAETEVGSKQEWSIIPSATFATDQKLLIQGSSGQHLENREGDPGLDLEIGPIQMWEISTMEGKPACTALGQTGGATPPSDKETVADGYCVNFNEGGTAGRGAGFSSFPGIDGEECFQNCRNDPMCLQAVYQQEGAGAPMCWTGVNTMPVKPAASRVGMVDHCMAKLGFDTGPDTFTKLGKGTCPEGLWKYASNNPADAVNIGVCQLSCMTDPECKYISFKEGVTCSKYNGGTGNCHPLVEDATMTTFRRDPAQIYHYFPMGAGKCGLGWYTNGNAMDAMDLTACQTACTLESNCKYFSYQAGKGCVRFNELAAPCLERNDGKADHTTYRKDATFTPGFTAPPTPVRGDYRTDFGRCIYDEFASNPAATLSGATLPCYIDCLKYKASYAPRMCQRMCVNALVFRGKAGDLATNTCISACPAAAAAPGVWIADFICPPMPPTPEPEPAKP